MGVNILFRGAATKIIILYRVNSRRYVVQTLNGTSLSTMGTIYLMVQAKPFKHLMTFHMMDNPSPYNTILDGESLHAMGNVLFEDKISPRYLGVMPNSERSNNKET